MEIRRCDKCDKALNPDEIENLYVGAIESDAKIFNVTVPVLKESIIAPPADTGLDDRDEFGNTFYGRRIDLCETCLLSLSQVMTDWLK